MKQFRWLIVFVVLIGGLVTVELVSNRRADPTDRISNLREFLAWRPSADEFAAVEVNGQRHVIAYGPFARALPSGPSAYMFDATGNLVDWSSDIGDDPAFDDKWGAQRAYDGEQVLSRLDVEKLAATRPAG